MKTDPNRCALPSSIASGLTKRELFAAIAMHAYATVRGASIEGVAEDSVKLADALVAALNAQVQSDG